MVELTEAPPFADIADPATFSTLAQAYFQWLAETFVSEMNGIVLEINGIEVQATPTDDTSGRILLVGAFGLGDSPINSSGTVPFSDHGGFSGFIHSSSTVNQPSDTPQSGKYNFGLTINSNATRGAQVLANSDERMFFRIKETTQGSWFEIYTQNSVLGTVSETSGVPTGALIEEGSNANGEYVRFADGLQICTHTLSSSASAAVTWTFPAAFSASPDASATAVAAAARMCTMSSVSSTSIDFHSWDDTGSRTANACLLMAVGRWF